MKKIQYDPNVEIFFGDRSELFARMLASVVERSGLSKRDQERVLFVGMEKFSHAFTSRTADPVNNYEFYEQLGDMFVNTFIVNYAYERFPQLRTCAGVQIVARIRIKYGSRENLYQLGDKLGFWPFISASVQHRHDNRKSLLEDVFEAVMGVLGHIIDEHFMPARCGFKYVYNVLSSIFSEVHISLKYTDLYDSITILKETFDYFKNTYRTIGKQQKEHSYDETTLLCTCKIYRQIDGTRHFLGSGTAARQSDAEQRAATVALEAINRIGFKKPEPAIFAEMEGKIVDECNVRLFNLDGFDRL